MVTTMLAPCNLQDWQEQVAGNHIKPLWSLGPSLPGLREGSLCVYDEMVYPYDCILLILGQL